MAATSLTVTGEGPPNAKGILVGEAPGAVEGVYYRPFVGQAGKLLRGPLLGPVICSKVFITNILACRPPKNRDPEIQEGEKCIVRLQELVSILQPKLIVAIGRVAESWLGSVVRMLPIETTFVYHPAYLLRNGVTMDSLKAKPNPKDWSGKIGLALGQYNQLRETILNL